MNKPQINPEKISFSIVAEPEDRALAPAHFSNSLTAEEIGQLLGKARRNVWQWCTVEIRGQIGPLTASEFLGGCNYKSQKDFIESCPYFDEMKEEVTEQLRQQLTEILAATE